MSESLNPGWIQTHSLKRVCPMDIRPEDIDMNDIAVALSRRYRFAGHSHRPISVAHHSLLVALACPNKYQIHGLLHDAAEAYLGDIVSPLKSVLPYQLKDWVTQAEALINVAIYQHLGIEGPDKKAREAVAFADQVALVTEARLFWDSLRPDFVLPNVDPLRTSETFRQPSAELARNEFESQVYNLKWGMELKSVFGVTK